MSSQVTGQFLVLVLRPRLILELLPEDPGSALVVEGTPYLARHEGDITGFYDWLRSRDGELLGIRCTSVKEEPDVLRGARGRSYARIASDESTLELFFSSARNFEPSLSADQAFGGNIIYASSAGEIALSFETYALNEAELHMLRVYCSAGRRGIH